MGLRRRLIISNAAIVIIPVIITIVAFFILFFVSTRILNIDLDYSKTKQLAQIQYELFRANGEILDNSPEVLLEKEFQSYIASKLDNIDGEVVILKNNQTIFATKEINLLDRQKILNSSNIIFNTVEITGGNYIVNNRPVFFNDGESGNVFLLVHTDKDLMGLERLMIILLAIFILSFIITNQALTYTLSKRVLRPLSNLQESAKKISGGDLDFEIIEDGDEEIRNLCRTFEIMRIELKNSTSERIKYDDSRKMLLSSISHDLRTPITSIKGYVEGILDGVANEPAKVDKYLKTIYSKADLIDRMIDDLFLYSRLDLNQLPFNYKKVDAIEYFKDFVNDMRSELEKDSVKINFNNEVKEQAFIMVDDEKLKRVITNVIDNSKKYMNKDIKRVYVFLRETLNSIICEIKDNGCGIEEQEVAHIFDRFYRSDSARGEKEGTGLGLAIAKQIIEGMGGRIWATSKKNMGTSIMISLKKLKEQGETR